MGKLAVYKYFAFMFLVVQLLVSAFTFFGLFGGAADPGKNTALAMLVYILPIMVLLNAILALYWIIRRRWHWLAIPAVTLICCIPYVGTLYQPSLFRSYDESKSGLKIASYNVALFGREMTGFKAEDILSEMKKQKIDVLCLQEYMERSGDKENSKSYKEYFSYMCKGRDDMVIFSRYPIKSQDIIDFGPTNNSGMWADIDVNGKLIRIFNVHLETTGFNRTLHKAAKMEMEGAHIEENALVKAIYGNYTRGMIVRAAQANIVAQKIRESNLPVIVCGDFNDVPYSYVYKTVKGDLVDAFKECGHNWMYTFRGKKKVRIDYIFYDEQFTGEHFYKMDLSYSDHYPVFLKLSLQNQHQPSF